MEYQSLEAAELADYSSVAGTFCSAAMLVVAFLDFKSWSAKEALLSGLAIAALPFVSDEVLDPLGFKLNVHGSAFLAYFLHLVAMCACAMGLLIGVTVRAIHERRPKT